MAFQRAGQQATAPRSFSRAAPQQGAPQFETAGSAALQPAGPSAPVEIETYDGQHYVVSFEDVRRFVCPKATEAECKIFLETCRAYRLNPFTKEAHLIHYDNKNDDAASTIVLGKNCYLKLAEQHPQYDGFEAGLILCDTKTGETYSREGSLLYEGETLLGGWAKVYRKDRSRPSYDEVRLAEYNTGKSLWASKPATMIRKVALVHALREAFPSIYGAVYDESELDVDVEATARELDGPVTPPRRSRRKAAPRPAVEIVPVDDGDSSHEPDADAEDDPFVEVEEP